MGCVGNALWFVLGGLVQGLSWLLFGALWCVTIIGIPVGLQCFKLAGLAFFPFGKQVVYGGGAVSVITNVFWILFGGLALAAEAAVLGVVFCATIIGIPFGRQCFKLAKLSLMPFGAMVRPAL